MRSYVDHAPSEWWQGNIATAKTNTFWNFFGTDKTRGIYSGKKGFATGKKFFIDPIKNGRVLNSVGVIKEGGTFLSDAQFPKHLQLLQLNINKGMWMFIQALGTHAKTEFQKSFDYKKGPFDGRGTFSKYLGKRSWKSLKKSTKENRQRLGLWPGRPFGGGQLTATGRLYNSITLKTTAGGEGNSRDNGALASVMVFTDPAKFKGIYPERKKKRGSGFTGRANRIYAGWHNEQMRGVKHKPPQRRFMGMLNDNDHRIQELMDDYLFYGVFNQSLGAFSQRGYDNYNKFWATFEQRKADLAKARAIKQEYALYGENSLQ